MKAAGISFIIPAFNEEPSIVSTVERLHAALQRSGKPYEIIVVDDGSTDETARKALASGKGAVIRHPINAGYGRAIKSGIATAQYDWIGIVDADGTYPIEDLPNLIKLMDGGFDMAIAFRANVAETDNWAKRPLRRLMIAVLNVLLGTSIVKDPNSGFRLFRHRLIEMFGPFLCNTFSFTTSLTIFAMGHGAFVGFVPITYVKRTGHSKVRHFRDSLRMLQLILEGISFYNPMKFYIILSFLLAVTVGLPAAGFYAVGWVAPALGYLIFGCTCALLAGIGMLCDIDRIGAGLKTAETTPPKRPPPAKT